MAADEQNIKNKMAQFLNEKFMEYQAKEIARGRGRPSQNDWVVWLGVAPTSMSMWLHAVRPPVGDNIDLLATKLGPEVYEILDVPPRMPKDKSLSFIAKNWHKLNDAQRAELRERVENLTFDDKNMEVSSQT